MSEAIATVNDYIFENNVIDSFTVVNYVGNKGSKGVKVKTGAIFQGYKEQAHDCGESRTEVWKVTRESWLKTRAGQS